MAAPDGTISVELRLMIEAAQKQAAAFAAKMKKDLADATKGSPMAEMADDAKEATDQQNKHTKAVKETTRAYTDAQKAAQRLRDIASGKISPTIPGMKITDVSGSGTIPLTQAEREEMGPAHRAGVGQGWSTSAGGGLATAAPYMGAKPPVLPTAAGTNIMDLVKNLRNIVLPIGQVTASFYLIGMVMRQATKPLQDFASSIAAAADAGKRLYAASAMSGMGTNMTAARNMYANALGVSESEIFQFGKQIQFLSFQLQNAVNVTAKANPALATMGIEFSVLRANLDALQNDMAATLAPVIIGLTMEITALAQAMTSLFDSIKNGMMNLLKSFSDTILPAWLSAMVKPMLDAANAIGKATIAAIGTPTAYMKQMPASSWERMGLQIGGGGGRNYQQETARNTAMTSAQLHDIYRILSGSEFRNAPQGLPASP